MTVLNGWHPGERGIHARLNVSEAVAVAYTWIDESMPEQHRQFYAKNLPFVPLTTLDKHGRPWGSILAGADGNSGFIRSPNETSLIADIESWDGDPLLKNIGDTSEKQHLIAGIGVEFPTRRRNKFAGKIEKIETTGKFSKRLHIHVNQAIGNCPKYINIRDLVPHPIRSPKVVYDRLELPANEHLSDRVIKFITDADTVFLGSVYSAKSSDEKKFPSHVGMNQRGGRAGFIRVRPTDMRTIVLPDYSGNRLLTSLGNIEASSLASMTFVDFQSGDVLYITGTARNLVGLEAQAVMPRQNVVTALYVTGYVLVANALPVCQREGASVGRSPYSPPIRYLAEEKGKDSETVFDNAHATLAKIEILSNSLARFWFETSDLVKIIPGQAAVLGFQELLGKATYAHMAPGNETSINDDRIRTWTVSSAHGDAISGGRTSRFAITMREQFGGLVTGALFSIARQASLHMPDILEDTRKLGMKIPLIGITGEFTLREGREKMLWIAGGIGVTPFLSMLEVMSKVQEKRKHEYDVVLLLSTREPDVLMSLIHGIFEGRNGFKITVYLFTGGSTPELAFPEGVNVISQKSRLKEDTLSSSEFKKYRLEERQAYICGPPVFEEVALGTMRSAGLDTQSVIREGFGY